VSVVEALRFAFVVEAAEAVGAEHGVLVVQVVEDGARRRTRCGSVVAGVEQLVTDEGGPGEGRG
jgi:hypothetical protein